MRRSSRVLPSSQMAPPADAPAGPDGGEFLGIGSRQLEPDRGHAFALPVTFSPRVCGRREEIAWKKFLEGRLAPVLAETRVLTNRRIGVRFIAGEEMARLNATFRGCATATNVLAFPPAAAAFVDPEDGVTYLGDVAVCMEVARREAETLAQPVRAHVTRLVVHGILHLLGYDHADPEGEDGMATAEAAVLTRLGFVISPLAG